MSITWQIYKRSFSCTVIIATSCIALPFRCGWDFSFCMRMAKPRSLKRLCSHKKNIKWADHKCTPWSCFYPNSYLTYTLPVVTDITDINGFTSLGKWQGDGLSLLCSDGDTLLVSWHLNSGTDTQGTWMLSRLLQSWALKQMLAGMLLLLLPHMLGENTNIKWWLFYYCYLRQNRHTRCCQNAVAGGKAIELLIPEG